ncbi:phosphatase PAP2 family protein [Xylophilus sp. Kf1]|nr:phosphatase PAP2 family protein [Xylophilus sp. Kf1]
MPIEFAVFQSPWMSWSFLTWFGDSNLLLPAAFVVAVALILGKSTRGLTPRWIVAFGMTGFLVLATKIAFIAWGMGSADLDFTGFSGHSALAACFWPVGAWLLVARPDGAAWRRGAIALGYLISVAIAGSRLALDVHSLSEVVSGFLVGAAGSAWFLSRASVAFATGQPRGSVPVPSAPARLLALGFLAAMTITLHGRPAPTTHWIERSTMQMLGVTTPFTRHDLRMRLKAS